MDDRELLERAAKAAGLIVSPIRQELRDKDGMGHVGLWIHGVSTCWNPLTDDGDALRLAMSLGLYVACTSWGPWVRDESNTRVLAAAPECRKADLPAIVRRQIVRAAAAMAPAGAMPDAQGGELKP